LENEKYICCVYITLGFNYHSGGFLPVDDPDLLFDEGKFEGSAEWVKQFFVLM
jgi:hypothetical protein